MANVAWEFYSGIGGLHLALQRSAIDGNVVRAFDWDQTACKVYSANHGPNVVQKVDISSLTPSVLASSAAPADLWLLSPSCQPYTVLNPEAKGALDPRARSFLHLIQTILPELVKLGTGVHPTRLLIENVAGFETSTTRQILLTTLRSLGYNTMEFLLTPLQFGIPNSRLRYYLLAKMAPLDFSTSTTSPSDGQIWRHIPGRGDSDWMDSRDSASPPSPISSLGSQSSVAPLRQFLDQDGAPIHGIPDRVLSKWGRLFDIVLPSSARTCCFTRGYTQLVERAGSIIQTDERLDTSFVFDEFLEARTNNPSAINILRPLGLRYFSPTELLRLFYFLRPASQDEFIWPEGLSAKSKYRLIGNSVNVFVVTELINFLYAG
ncbi:S-adenosyl-L-methionine-dependent methyltransferase [Pleurotus eryngii]|uniref:tRNA (cytosine(38)-C(5))-methyltransferase n=1 Tax=Pleurotus eryngii TaxID=5323 RepID=A0A9P6DAI1_PLEER|nr:S-adenosyl-L-methionine-dependent methyltransferase [Pleurotus eryngii]